LKEDKKNLLGVNTVAFYELENVLTQTWFNDHPADRHSSKSLDFGDTLFYFFVFLIIVSCPGFLSRTGAANEGG